MSEIFKDKPVLLVTDTTDEEWGERYLYDSVKTAQEAAANMSRVKTFDIFTLYSHGSRGDISWEPIVDHATNLRENKKVASGMRKGAWTQLEVDTLIQHTEAGMSVTDMSKALRRKYNSIFTKLKALGYK